MSTSHFRPDAGTVHSRPAFRDEMAGMLDLTTGNNRPIAPARTSAVYVCCAASAVSKVAKLAN